MLQEVAENPTLPTLSALAYTADLGYRPTCESRSNGMFCDIKFKHVNLKYIYIFLKYIAKQKVCVQ